MRFFKNSRVRILSSERVLLFKNFSIYLLFFCIMLMVSLHDAITNIILRVHSTTVIIHKIWQVWIRPTCRNTSTRENESNLKSTGWYTCIPVHYRWEHFKVWNLLAFVSSPPLITMFSPLWCLTIGDSPFLVFEPNQWSIVTCSLLYYIHNKEKNLLLITKPTSRLYWSECMERPEINNNN